ncbi:MAG: hypothetical protein RBS58_06235 [Syntrophales bacterium]|jgi:hypothetical protein|nr:hypothetical protein [Syntrophales bacterium]MDX9922237.1 hypothetical protein [Syntrophales bacterium]
MGVFADTTSMERTLYAVFAHENMKQQTGTPFLAEVTQNSWRYPGTGVTEAVFWRREPVCHFEEHRDEKSFFNIDMLQDFSLRSK